MGKEKKSEVSRTMSSDIVGYDDFLRELKTRISSAQLRAAIALRLSIALLANWARYSPTSTTAWLGFKGN